MCFTQSAQVYTGLQLVPDPNALEHIVRMTVPGGLLVGHAYHVSVERTALKNFAEEEFRGFVDADGWNFIVEGTSKPIGVVFPPHTTRNTENSSTLTITFTERMLIGFGTIEVHDISDDSVENIDVRAGLVDEPAQNRSQVAPKQSSQISIAGGVVTINLNTPLRNGRGYEIYVPPTAFKNAAQRFYAGTTRDTWNFYITGIQNVTAVQTIPFNGASEVQLPVSVVQVIFSENVVLKSGTLIVVDVSNKLSASYFVDSNNTAYARVNGVEDRNVLSITLSPPLALPGNEYYITVNGSIAESLAGFPFVGITGPNDWRFETEGGSQPTRVLTPADNTLFVREGRSFYRVVYDSVLLTRGDGNFVVTDYTAGSQEIIAATDTSRVLLTTFAGEGCEAVGGVIRCAVNSSTTVDVEVSPSLGNHYYSIRAEENALVTVRPLFVDGRWLIRSHRLC